MQNPTALLHLQYKNCQNKDRENGGIFDAVVPLLSARWTHKKLSINDKWLRFAVADRNSCDWCHLHVRESHQIHRIAKSLTNVWPPVLLYKNEIKSVRYDEQRTSFARLCIYGWLLNCHQRQIPSSEIQTTWDKWYVNKINIWHK
jgi:hypothetical protein